MGIFFSGKLHLNVLPLLLEKSNFISRWFFGLRLKTLFFGEVF